MQPADHGLEFRGLQSVGEWVDLGQSGPDCSLQDHCAL